MAVTLGPPELMTIGPNGITVGAAGQIAASGVAPAETFSNDPFASLEYAASAAPIAPKKQEFTLPSLLDIPVGLYEGVRRRLPEQIGQAMQMSGVAPDAGKALVEWARKGESQEPKSFVREGAEMVAPSIGVPGALYYGGKLLSALPHPAAKIIGTGMKLAAPIAGPGVMGLAQAQSTKETAEQAGVDPGNAPLINGLIEAVGETIGTVFLGRLFGIKELGGEVKQTFKEFLKDALFKVVPAENITEMAQQFGQSLVEKKYRIRPDADPISEAMSVIGPTTVMTLLTGAASATHRAYTGGFAKEQATPGVDITAAPAATGAAGAAGAPGAVVTPGAAGATPVATAVPVEVAAQVPDIYTMSPEVSQIWQELMAAEQAGAPSVEKQTYEITPESHPPGSTVRLGDYDFIVDKYTPEGVEGRRVIKERVGGLQGEATEDVIKLYSAAKSTLDYYDRKAGKRDDLNDQSPEAQAKRLTEREKQVQNVVLELITRPKAPNYTQEEIDTVTKALLNPVREETSTTDIESYPLEKLRSKTVRIIPPEQHNLTMEDLKRQDFKHIDDIVNYIGEKKRAGINVNTVVKALSDEDVMLSLLPQEKVAKKPIAVPNLFMSTPKETVTEEEIDAAIEAGAPYRTIPEMTKDGKKTGKMVIDYFPRDFRFFFKKKDYPDTEKGNRELKKAVDAKRAYLQAKLDSFKRPEFWQIYEERDEKGRIKSIKMARLVPEYVKSTSKWMAPTAAKVLDEARKATPERRRALASDMYKVLKAYLSSKYLAGEKVFIPSEKEVNIAETLSNYLERNRSKISPANIKKIEEYLRKKEEASEAEMDKLFGPVGEEAADEVFNLGGGEPSAKAPTAVPTTAIPTMPGEETFDVTTAQQQLKEEPPEQGVRRIIAAGKMMESLDNYIRGKGKISEKRFGDIAYNILRFKGGRDVIANFLAGKETGAEVVKKSEAKEKAAKIAKGEKVKLTDEQWNDYRADVREQLAKISNIDTSKKRLKILYQDVVDYLVKNKKLSKEEATKRIEAIRKEAMARALGSVTAAEVAASKPAAQAAKPSGGEELEKVDERRPLYTRRNDLMRAALIKLTGLDVSKEDNIKKIAKSVIDVPVAEGKEMVDEDKFKELNKIAYKKAKQEFEAGMLGKPEGQKPAAPAPKAPAPKAPEQKAPESKPEKAKTKATKVEWDDFGEEGQEYYKNRIRAEFSKLTGRNFANVQLGKVRERVLDTTDIHGKKITKEIIAGITSRIWDETSNKFAPEKFATVLAERKAEEEKAREAPETTKKRTLEQYHALRKEAIELGIKVPKGTKIDALEAMIAAHKAGKSPVAAAMAVEAARASKKKSAAEEEISEEETERAYEALFGEGEKPEGKKPEVKKPEIKKPEIKKPERASLASRKQTIRS